MDKTLLIIGAGCSAGSMFLPTDRNFLSIKRDDILKSYFLQKALSKVYYEHRVGPEWSTYRLEDVWSEIVDNLYHHKFGLIPAERDEIRHHLNKLANEEKLKNPKRSYYHFFQDLDSKSRTPYGYLFTFAEWELRKIVYTTYNKILMEDANGLYEKLLEFSRKYGALEIVSFNYDTLIEQALSKYYYAVIDTDFNEEGLKIIKPHGSVNWLRITSEYQTNSIDSVRKVDKPMMLEDFGYQDNAFYQPELVGLIDVKEQYNKQYGIYNDIKHELKLSIMNSNVVIIIGYGFPTGDKHIRGILQDASFVMKRDNRPTLKKIIMVCCLDEKETTEMQDDLSRLFYVNKEDIEIYSQDWRVWVSKQKN